MLEITIKISEQACTRLANLSEEWGISYSASIDRLLLTGVAADAAKQSGPPPVRGQLATLRDIIEYSPKGEENFKRELLRQKIAYIRIHFMDGRVVDKTWRAENFSETSQVHGNLATGYFRLWREKEICKAEVSITPFAQKGGN